MAKEKIIERLETMIKEEMWGRINPRDVSINKFKTLDDFFNNMIGENADEEAVKACKEHNSQYTQSVIAPYILGLIAYHKEDLDGRAYLIDLMNLYINAQKWAVVEHIAGRILEFGENRAALRALALSLEKLKKVKEAIPIWEDMLKMNRFDSEIAKKLAYAYTDDPQKSSQYLKIALEGYIKEVAFAEVEEILGKLIEQSWEDIPFFDKIEKLLSEAGQHALAAKVMKELYDKYSGKDDEAIEILKKIIKHNKDDVDARKKIIKHYESKHASHSQLQQFITYSKIDDFTTPVRNAIDAFENYIIFDKGNYVYHRSWGLGLISDIDKDGINIDFKDKPGHRMAVQMALQSLTPLPHTHIYVEAFEKPEEIKNLFAKNFIEFFRKYIYSYNKVTNVSQMKKDFIPQYVAEKDWAKWWSKARLIIKKDSEFAFSETKKDEIFVRDKPVTYRDDLMMRFGANSSFSSRLDIAVDYMNNVDADKSGEHAEMLAEYFTSMTKDGSNTKLILSYFVLKSLEKYTGKKNSDLADIRKNILAFISKSGELALISNKISAYDYKKDFVNLVFEARDDWKEVTASFLYEMPVRIHKYIINNLIQEHGFEYINKFIDRVMVGYREFPEIFMWIAKNILSGLWNYEWLDYSRQNLVLGLFRLVNELKKIEPKGARLKNMLTEILFGNENELLRTVAATYDKTFCAKVYDLISNADYIDDSQREIFLGIIKEKHPDFSPQMQGSGAEIDLADEEIAVLKSGYDKKVQELSTMVNVELVQLTKQLSSVSDLSGDIRENVDYNTLMEKQTILKKTISRLDAEIKKAKIIDLSKVSTEHVNPGTIVTLENPGNGEKKSFSILGPWDADFEKNILSYRSAAARAMLKKKIGEEVMLHIGEMDSKFKIINIEVCK